jgi:thymidylate synthase (FAD)
MKVIKAYTQICGDINGQEILKKIEAVGRTCYKSEDKIKEGSAEKFVSALINRGHEAMLEHASITIKFVVDRGISHELVRHRLASFAQESTRYCNYSKDAFETEITFILPESIGCDTPQYEVWKDAMQKCEDAYFSLLDIGLMPEMARAVLPNSLKTEVIMTANLREWRHFFKLRAANTTGKAHPQMLEVTIPLLEALKVLIPVVFDDIKVGDYDA